MSYKLTTKITWGQTMRELQTEFKLWEVEEWETSKPRGMKFEGWNQNEEDRTVMLRWKKEGREIVLQMGTQDRAVDNLRVLYLAVNSMRLNEKRGIGEVLKSAYKQLAAPEGAINIDPYEELGIMRNSDLNFAEAVYKMLAKKYHPDNGGNPEKMNRLNKAIEMLRNKHG